MTAGNAEGRYIGRTDLPVTEEGMARLRALGCDETVDTVYVTPLCRTQQTASLFFPRARQILLPELTEKDFGDFEGRSPEDMAEDPAYRKWVAEGAVGGCPNAESAEQFASRIGEGFDRLVTAALARGEKRLTLVGHGGAFMALMILFAHDGRPYYDWFAPNGGGWRAEIAEESWRRNKRLERVRPVLGPLDPG